MGDRSQVGSALTAGSLIQDSIHEPKSRVRCSTHRATQTPPAPRQAMFKSLFLHPLIYKMGIVIEATS